MTQTDLLDVRPEISFHRAHAPGAANIPLEDLAARIHELTPDGSGIAVVDEKSDRAQRAAQFLQGRGYPVRVMPFEPASLTEHGAARAHLWQPNPFLVEALSYIPTPPNDASALDIACGSGRDAVYLRMRSYRVTAIDVLPDALQKAQDLAQRHGVQITTRQQDLEADAMLPANSFDLVTVFRFLHRPLFPAIRDAVKPGGYVVYETFHERTRVTGRPPRSPEHLLRDGELPKAFGGFEVLIAGDGIERDGRYVSSLLARSA
jgi:SAM-dependent methyltransferase